MTPVEPITPENDPCPPGSGWYDDAGDHDPGDECGRWNNARLMRSCVLAGTEFCDFECPFRDTLP